MIASHARYIDIITQLGYRGILPSLQKSGWNIDYKVHS